MTTVIVVEDNRPLAELSKRLLEGEGYEVAVCGNAREAKLISWANVAVAVVDWMLPGDEDGPALIGWLNEHHPDVHCILTTSAPTSLTDIHGTPEHTPLLSKADWPYGLLDAVNSRPTDG